VKKLLALGLAAAAILVPASPAAAADVTRASLSDVLTAYDGGGAPLEIGGVQVEPAGATVTRGLKWSLRDWEVSQTEPVAAFVFDTGELCGPLAIMVPLGESTDIGVGTLTQAPSATACAPPT
jgi:hypothetical protein